MPDETHACTCTRFRCFYYEAGVVSPVDILNCTTTAWVMTCNLSCPLRNYALRLEPTLENPNGNYVP